MKWESHENRRKKRREEEGEKRNLPSSPNNHTTGGKKCHKGGKFSLPREKEELLAQYIYNWISFLKFEKWK
jgi:hypothetical protein